MKSPYLKPSLVYYNWYKCLLNGKCGLKAITTLTPKLESGLSLTDAKIECQYQEVEVKDIKARIENITNPTVRQALYEVIRLIRAISKQYGKPEKIRVELARDLRQGKKVREKIFKENKERADENKRIRDDLSKKNKKPTKDAILRYKLWEECDKTCPYTGKQISFDDLFSENRSFDIEHIIPYGKKPSYAFTDLTLCYVEENKRKSNLTPYEAYAKDKARYKEILDRVKKFPYPKNKNPKLKLFKQKTIPEDFISRQLQDTAYLSVEAKKLLEILDHEVTSSKGMATSRLREPDLWDLNRLLYDKMAPRDVKVRVDHRHHAVDAAVIAMTDVGVMQRMSRYNKYNKDPRLGKFDLPWEGFRDDLQQAIKKILVSFRVHKRFRGGLHESNYFHFTGKKQGPYSIYTQRKELEKQKLSVAAIGDLDNLEDGKIKDGMVRKIIKKHLKNQDFDPSKYKNKSIPKKLLKGLYFTTSGGKEIPIRKVVVEENKKEMTLLPGIGAYVPTGRNHHIVIYEYRDGNEWKQAGEIIPLFTAVQRLKRKEPPIKRDLGSDKRFLYSLAQNEMFLLNVDKENLDWDNLESLSPHLYRVQKFAEGAKVNTICLRHHLVAKLKDVDGKEPGRILIGPHLLKGIKVRLDRMGRIYKAND